VRSYRRSIGFRVLAIAQLVLVLLLVGSIRRLEELLVRENCGAGRDSH
jgi:hypothetical protein